jgi:hypothetical protein
MFNIHGNWKRKQLIDRFKTLPNRSIFLTERPEEEFEDEFHIIKYIPEWQNFNHFQRDPSGGTLWNNQGVNADIMYNIIKEKLSDQSFYLDKYLEGYPESDKKKYVPKKNLNCCVFNLALLTYRPIKNKKVIKKIDFFFYYKKHPNKSNNFLVNIINLLLLKNYKIYIAGDFLNNKRIINLGYIDKNQIFFFLKQSKFTINSGENFLSLFAIDSYACSTIVFYNSLLKNNFDFLDFNSFIPINFSNLDQAYKKIVKVYYEKKYFNKFNDRLIIDKSKEVKKNIFSYLVH